MTSAVQQRLTADPWVSAANVQYSDSFRSVNLVSARAQEVNSHCVYVDQFFSE